MVKSRQTIDPNLFARTEPEVGAIRESSLPEALLASQDTSKPAITKEPPIKATYYLSPATLDAVDAIQAKLRKLAPQERRALNKSAIVDQMLLLAAEHLQDSKTVRQFTSKLVNQ